ncbi:MAG: hypothetical protein CMJ75_22010 [Planctomycetaceae bacterium]|nr:hypothetical protein [Planctomycetaceae bacterium]
MDSFFEPWQDKSRTYNAAMYLATFAKELSSRPLRRLFECLQYAAKCETAPEQHSQFYLMGKAVLFSTLFHVDRAVSDDPFSTFSLVVTTAKSAKGPGNTGTQRAGLTAGRQRHAAEQREFSCH